MTNSSDDLVWRLRNASRREIMLALGAGTGGLVAANSAWAAVTPAGPATMETPEPDEPEQPMTMVELQRDVPMAARVVDDVINRAIYTTVAAAAGITVGPRADGLAHSARTLFASYGQSRRDTQTRAAQDLLNAPLAVRSRIFGRYAALTPIEMVTLTTAQISAKVGPVLGINGNVIALLKRQFGPVDDGSNPETEPPGPTPAEESAADMAAGKKYKHLEVAVRRIECLYYTPDPGPHDEIAIGGYGVGPTGGQTHAPSRLVSEWFTHKGKTNQMDDLRARDYGQYDPMPFIWFNINQKPPWPHDYQLGMVLGEKDYGGFASFLSDLWDDVGFLVIEAIGGAVGSLIPIPGLGTLIGISIGAIINAIIKALKDDVVGSIHSTIKLNGLKKSYYRKKYPTSANPKRHGDFAMSTGAKDGMWYKRDFTSEGHYRVKILWRAFTDEGKEKRDAQIKAGIASKRYWVE